MGISDDDDDDEDVVFTKAFFFVFKKLHSKVIFSKRITFDIFRYVYVS